jgi:hypothetical protein
VFEFDNAIVALCHKSTTDRADSCLGPATTCGMVFSGMERSMLQDPAWQAIDDLTRAQLTMFHALGDHASLTGDDRRRALALDDRTWSAWLAFLSDGPLPAEPPLPEMLRRVGEAAFHLSRTAEGGYALGAD